MKRLASLILLLVLAGSAFAGVPLHFGESECSMDGMADMDCCKAVLRTELRAERNDCTGERCSRDPAFAGTHAVILDDTAIITKF